ncbi:hypothetical protein QTV49_001846 [Vibrio vulnificus]|nr:hypothetical protein [Vibrio vulnificus]
MSKQHLDPENVKLIDSLLLVYGKLHTSDLTAILRCKISKVRKLTGAYVKEYEAKFGTKPYDIVTVGHYAKAGGSRHLEAITGFEPLLVENDKSKCIEFIKACATKNSVRINETSSDGDKLILLDIEELEGARNDSHYYAFGVIDTLLKYQGEFDLIELQTVLSLENPKAARYLVTLYSQESDVTYNKQKSIYEKGQHWKPVSLTSSVNDFTFLTTCLS